MVSHRLFHRMVKAFLLLSIVWPAGTSAVWAQTILLDNFEVSAIRVVQPGETNPEFHYLWNQYTGDFSEGPDPGLASISTTVANGGTRSLKVAVSGGNLYLQFYPHNGSVWRWMREYTQPSANWQMNTFNRMRIWMKVPPQVQAAQPGRINFNIGTFVRASNGDPTSAESGGAHLYHHYNIPYTGEWHQLIWDTHPNHNRGGAGDTEWGDMPYPTGQSGFNYFDALTRFYLDFQGRLSSHPADFYVDGFELYRETNPENTTQIYSLNGVYVPSTNKIYVGWQRNKNENTINHEIRYAFQSIFTIGWAAATPAPNGTITPPDWQGYNGMEWSTTSINVGGQSTIYIGIKPQNSSGFRQIAIPLSSGGVPPAAPTGVRVR